MISGNKRFYERNVKDCSVSKSRCKNSSEQSRKYEIHTCKCQIHIHERPDNTLKCGDRSPKHQIHIPEREIHATLSKNLTPKNLFYHYKSLICYQMSCRSSSEGKIRFCFDMHFLQMPFMVIEWVVCLNPRSLQSLLMFFSISSSLNSINPPHNSHFKCS